jgi:hypothetical protein
VTKSAERIVVTALHNLLFDVQLEQLLAFLHKLHMRFTLRTSEKGLYVCEVYKQAKDDGSVATVEKFSAGGKSPKAALINTISEFLGGSYGDFHEYVIEDWPGVNGPTTQTRRARKQARGDDGAGLQI